MARFLLERFSMGPAHRSPFPGSLLAAALLLACGGDDDVLTEEDTDGTSSSTTKDGSPTTSSGTTSESTGTSTSSGSSTGTSTDTESETDAITAPDADVVEREGSSPEGTVQPGQSFAGVVDEADDDTFAMQLGVGELVELELRDSIGAQVPLRVNVYARATDIPSFDAVNRSRQFDIGEVGGRWQFFAPVAGRYEFSIGQNTFSASDQGPIGYAFLTRTIDISAMASAIPGEALVESHAITVRSVILDQPAALLATMRDTESRYGVPNVRVWDPAAQVLEPVLERRTEEEQSVSMRALAQPYWIIADFDGGYSGDRFTVAYATADDAPGAPIELALDAPHEGTLDAGDIDYFQVTARAGQLLRAELRGDANLDVMLEVFAYADGDPDLTASSVEGVAGVEFSSLLVYSDEDVDHRITVRSPSGISGPYAITLTEVTPDPTAVDPEVVVDGPLSLGGYRWFRPEGDDEVLTVFRTSQASATEPWFVGWDGSHLFDHSGFDYAGRVRHPQAWYSRGVTPASIGVRERYFRGGEAFQLTGTLQSVDLSAMSFGTVSGAELLRDPLPTSRLPVRFEGTAHEPPDLCRIAVDAGKLYLVIYERTGEYSEYDASPRFVDQSDTAGWYGEWTAENAGAVLTYEATEAGVFEFEVPGDCTDDDLGYRCAPNPYALRILVIE